MVGTIDRDRHGFDAVPGQWMVVAAGSRKLLGVAQHGKRLAALRHVVAACGYYHDRPAFPHRLPEPDAVCLRVRLGPLVNAHGRGTGRSAGF